MADAPCANLAEELMIAYPNAKVVLNVRDVDTWLPSMETSYYAILGWKWLQRLAAVETVRVLGLFYFLSSICSFHLYLAASV